MMRKIAGDYIRTYRWSNLKELWKEDTQTSFSLFWIVIIIFIGMLFDDYAPEDYLIVGMIGIPMGFAMFSSALHSVRPSKIFYLCPMNVEERRKYMQRSYYFKVGFEMCFCIAGIVIIIPLSQCDFLSAIGLLLSDLSICILVRLRTHTDGNHKGEESGYLHKMCILFIAYMLNIAQMALVSDESGDRWVKLLILAVLLCIQLPLTISYAKYLKEEFKKAEYYEMI